MKINQGQYESIIIYGIGQYFESIKEDLFQYVEPDYLCDRKWDDDVPSSYHGIPIIKRKELPHLKNSLIIITTGSPWITASIKNELKLEEASVIHANEVLGRPKSITGKELKEASHKGYYQDIWENRIYFNETVPNSIIINFLGKKNTLEIGTNVTVNNLKISFGNGGRCSIGERTEVMGANFAVSGASLKIGRDCLLSFGVFIRNHDSHHIFDVHTHERINYPKDIVIDDHVWIGQNAIILPGAGIGRNSIVGAGTVTSGQFGENLIIAGCPARVIRKQVCWSREDTAYFSYDTLEECASQEALKYL